VSQSAWGSPYGTDSAAPELLSSVWRAWVCCRIVAATQRVVGDRPDFLIVSVRPVQDGLAW
jgi:hypothetical protein